MEWNPMLFLTSERLVEAINVMDPPSLDAVVVMGGLWLVQKNWRRFTQFRNNLKRIAQNLIDLRTQRKVIAVFSLFTASSRSRTCKSKLLLMLMLLLS